MKKQNVYTIQDDLFMDALKIVHDHFDDVPYAIVGGGAVQVYVVSIAIKQAQLRSVKDINGLSFILRRTGDIDLSFHCDVTKLINKFNGIIERTTGSYRFHSFAKRFVIQAGKHRFNLNYQTEPVDLKGIPSYYYDIIETAIDVELPHNNIIFSLKIAKPEYLIVSKLTRVKPKDHVDIILLLNAMESVGYPFDSEEVRSILKSIGKPHNYDILLELMDSR
ncbi:MAG: hypothetical protein GY801_11145 [bacterium]|nr:hypothetical protein [bacterium]